MPTKKTAPEKPKKAARKNAPDRTADGSAVQTSQGTTHRRNAFFRPTGTADIIIGGVSGTTYQQLVELDMA